MLSALALIALAYPTPQAPPVDFTKFAPYSKSSDIGDFIHGPKYAPAPELTAREGVPKGKVFRFVMDSKDSKMYPGISKTAVGVIVPYTRRVTVYVPTQLKPGKAAPFLISQDSVGAGQIPTILDNMIADKRLPAMVAIMIDSGGSDAQGSQRGLEYDAMTPHYAQFVESEVLPRVTQETGVTLTKDPNARLTMGVSSGAACAFTMAWYRTDLYRRVLSYSGTYVNQAWPPNPDTIKGAWEYHDRLIPQSKRKPLRIWLQVGEWDNRWKDEEATYHNWVMANQRMAAVLKAKGYPYQFLFSRESGHGDWKVITETLPQALEWVWRGYRASR